MMGAFRTRRHRYITDGPQRRLARLIFVVFLFAEVLGFVPWLLHPASSPSSPVRDALWYALLSLPAAVVAGLLLYHAVAALLLRPLERLSASLDVTHADPERHTPLGTASGSAAVVALADLQRELRAAQWHRARLAALAAAVSRANHDLRGVLSPALLTAERLQMAADPAIKRAGDVLVRAVERAAEVMRGAVEQAREYPALPGKFRLPLRPVVEDAAEQARGACPGLAVENTVADSIDIEADRDSMVRVFANLLRNAGRATAHRVRVSAEVDGSDLAITVSDDGPGLPEPVRAAPFRPFAGDQASGVGLAIVRELVRAQGGEASLLTTGPAGTSFRLVLPTARAALATPKRASAGRG